MKLTPRQAAVVAILDREYPFPLSTRDVSHLYELAACGIEVPADYPGDERTRGYREYTKVYPVLRQLQHKRVVDQIRVEGFKSVYWRLDPESPLAVVRNA